MKKLVIAQLVINILLSVAIISLALRDNDIVVTESGYVPENWNLSTAAVDVNNSGRIVFEDSLGVVVGTDTIVALVISRKQLPGRYSALSDLIPTSEMKKVKVELKRVNRHLKLVFIPPGLKKNTCNLYSSFANNASMLLKKHLKWSIYTTF